MDPLGDIMGTSAGPNRKREIRYQFFQLKKQHNGLEKVKNSFTFEACNNKMSSSTNFWYMENALCHHSENKIIVQ